MYKSIIFLPHLIGKIKNKFCLKVYFVMFFLISFCSTVSATGYSQWGTIQELYFGSGGNTLLVTMSFSDSLEYCSQSDIPHILKLDETNELTKDFYKTKTSALLAAYAAGKEVRFYLTTNNCSNGRPIIQGVGLR